MEEQKKPRKKHSPQNKRLTVADHLADKDKYAKVKHFIDEGYSLLYSLAKVGIKYSTATFYEPQNTEALSELRAYYHFKVKKHNIYQIKGLPLSTEELDILGKTTRRGWL